MYQNVLSQQWNDLVTDFTRANKNIPGIGCNLQSWYQARVHRFSSVTGIEAMTLEQVRNPDFAKALRDKIDNFVFKQPDVHTIPTPRMGIIVGAAVGVATFFLLPFFPFTWAKLWTVRILIGIVTFIAIAISAICSVLAEAEKERQRVLAEYTQQLQNYLPTLLDVCRNYGID